jgi:hypothetical protein
MDDWSMALQPLSMSPKGSGSTVHHGTPEKAPIKVALLQTGMQEQDCVLGMANPVFRSLRGLVERL